MPGDTTELQHDGPNHSVGAYIRDARSFKNAGANAVMAFHTQRLTGREEILSSHRDLRRGRRLLS